MVQNDLIRIFLCIFRYVGRETFFYLKASAHPDHKHRLPDVPHAIIYQTRGINELVLIHWLAWVGTESFHGCLYLLSETWHHCKYTHRKDKQQGQKQQTKRGNKTD